MGWNYTSGRLLRSRYSSSIFFVKSYKSDFPKMSEDFDEHDDDVSAESSSEESYIDEDECLEFVMEGKSSRQFITVCDFIVQVQKGVWQSVLQKLYE
ncbi:hypothetical protein Tco_0713350 [Tanacetum coccineum]